MDFLFLFVIVLVSSAFGLGQEDYLPITDWLDQEVNSYRIDFVGISADSAGNIYLLENTSNQVFQFSPNGDSIVQWQATFSENPYPTGISIDKSDYIYINDGQKLGFEKFSPKGEYISEWNYVQQAQEIPIPLFLHVDIFNNFYLFGETAADNPFEPSNGVHIKKFSSNGEQLAEFYVYGVVPRSLSVASDSIGNLYLLDDHHSKIVKLLVDGTTLEWGSLGTQNGEFNFPTGIAIDSENNVYVADSYNQRIQKFSSNGEFLAKWHVEDQPVLLAVDDKDNVYAVTSLDFVKKFSTNGKLLASLNPIGSSQKMHLTSPVVITSDSAENVYVVDSDTHRVVKMDNSGNFLTQWSLKINDDDERPRFPSGIAVDSNDDVYVVDSFSPFVQKFSNKGEFLAQWNVEDYDSEQSFSNPTRLEFDSDDNVYTLDRNGQMYKFSPENKFAWTVNLPSGNILTQDIAVDSENFVYVSDSENQQVLKFSGNDGKLVKTLGVPVNHTGQYYPSGLGIDSKDNLYVVEEMTRQIIKYSNDVQTSQWNFDIRNDTSYASGLDMTISDDDRIYLTTMGEIIVHDKPDILVDETFDTSYLLFALLPILGLIGFFIYKKQKRQK